MQELDLVELLAWLTTFILVGGLVFVAYLPKPKANEPEKKISVLSHPAKKRKKRSR